MYDECQLFKSLDGAVAEFDRHGRLKQESDHISEYGQRRLAKSLLPLLIKEGGNVVALEEWFLERLKSLVTSSPALL